MDIDKLLKSIPRREIPSEMDRILSIPQVEQGDGVKESIKWTKRLGTGGATFRPTQGLALDICEKYGGGFLLMQVGYGKTLVALAAGQAAGATNPLILVPPALVKQMHSEMEYWSKRFRFRKSVIESYNRLSTVDGLLESIKPDMIIADEAHNLRHKGSVRTRRFLRYFRNNPRCGFLALSGTMTSKSLMEYAHLLELALRENAPIPLDYYDVQRWAACVDPKGEPNKSDLLSMAPLIKWAELGDFAVTNKKYIRKAFKKRLVSAPGVITTVSGSCGASLYLPRHKVEHSAEIKKALKVLKNQWELPDGEPIADASVHSFAQKNLSLGFYYQLDWCKNGPNYEWLEARRSLDRLVARVLRYSPREGRDSPALVIEWSRAGGGSNELRDAIHAWDQIRYKAKPKTVPVWICEQKIDYLMNWVNSQKKSTIVWYRSKAIEGKLKQHGMSVHGEGSDAPSGQTCAASIAVHGKGRNLQMYHNCFIVETPSNGGTFEQLLGRTHRSGQKADAVWWNYFEFGTALRKAKKDAEYIQETTGSIQKLNLATFIDYTKEIKKC